MNADPVERPQQGDLPLERAARAQRPLLAALSEPSATGEARASADLLAEMDDYITRLRSRLSPVLGPDSPHAVDPSTALLNNDAAELVVALRDNNARLRSLIRLLGDITDRLQVGE